MSFEVYQPQIYPEQAWTARRIWGPGRSPYGLVMIGPDHPFCLLMVAHLRVELGKPQPEPQRPPIYPGSGFFEDMGPRKKCLACGQLNPKAKHTGEWYHWTDHPETCPAMPALAMRTIEYWINGTDPNIAMAIACAFPTEVAVLTRQLEAKT